jgi:DNA (cytosine-5)-methyltransferase 1
VALSLRAIDLYSGVGGWSLGLRLAGIDVVSSYEWWGPANETNFKNNLHQAQTVDIRRLTFDDLPKNIDIVVGSPPCTQFSFSNRGGNGDLDDGLEDIIKFLSVVDFIKPKFWAMENVPRVAPIIEKELKVGGRLHSFAHLGVSPHIIDMDKFGVPQRRRRCVAGNFDFDLLASYQAKQKNITLGDVVKALAADPVIDPLYGLQLAASAITEHHLEEPLNEEESRINKAAKLNHHIYNSMPFPDPLDRTVRTITATCTRVSRESIVIENSTDSLQFRRLSVRERACLQGFPITFQFYGQNNGQKMRMVGNAVPPAFSFLMGQAFRGIPAEKMLTLKVAGANLVCPKPLPKVTPMDQPGARYPITRTFRFAITSLQLKSGVRFELSNQINGDQVRWVVTFWFGNSKSIQNINLDIEIYKRIHDFIGEKYRHDFESLVKRLAVYLESADVANMQKLWCHRGPGKTRPFMLLDELCEVGEEFKKIFDKMEDVGPNFLSSTLKWLLGEAYSSVPGIPKLLRNYSLILSGLVVGALANDALPKHFAESSDRVTTKQ